MSLNLYNTLSNQKEVFIPQNPKEVSLYVCGPTVYNYAHIGNARSAVVFDLLYRLLLYLYPKVHYARNITDVDDKIIEKAKEENSTIDEITSRYFKIYTQNMKALQVKKPSIEPRATEHITDMISMIENLIQKGHAYLATDHVFFHVPSYLEYGKLSKRKVEEMLPGARVKIEKEKKDPADFVLWKPSFEKEVFWESPWGKGRPGWHIECSAMIHSLFGKSVDIHGGGLDLIFPHHENEIAQSSCLNHGHNCAKYWVHNGFVHMKKEKMSKSLGNVCLVNDLLKETKGEVIRLALLSTHYRSPIEWDENLLHQAKRNLDRFYTSLQSVFCDELPSSKEIENEVEVPVDFLECLKDDLNTSTALASLFPLSHAIHNEKKEKEKKKRAYELLACARLLGILEENPQSWFQQSHKESFSPSEIEKLIEERNLARKNKDYKKSDEIRDKLKSYRITLKDNLEKTTWQHD